MALKHLLHILSSRRGSALIISMLVLLVLTAVGIFAVTTSTMETRIAGTEKTMENAFYAADGCTDYGLQMIEWILNNPGATSLPSGASSPDLDDLKEEILGNDTSHNPTVTTTIGDFNLNISLERLMEESLPGYSLEFGTAEDESKNRVYYRIDASSSGNANARVVTTYRRMIE